MSTLYQTSKSLRNLHNEHTETYLLSLLAIVWMPGRTSRFLGALNEDIVWCPDGFSMLC